MNISFRVLLGHEGEAFRFQTGQIDKITLREEGIVLVAGLERRVAGEQENDGTVFQGFIHPASVAGVKTGFHI